jgi:hypothetical protein
MLCKHGENYTTWKNIPNEDKLVLLKHMSELKNMWLDTETFSKHKIMLVPKFTHLLGDASDPKGKEATTTESTLGSSSSFCIMALLISSIRSMPLHIIY